MNEWECQNLSFSYLPWRLLATELWNTVSFLSWQSWRTPSLIGSLQLFSITLGIWSLDASFSVCSPLWSLLHRLNEHLVEEHLSSSCKISATSLFKKKKKKVQLWTNFDITSWWLLLLFPGENSKKSWVPVWLLHSRHCHVHVHIASEQTWTQHGRHRRCFPR